MKPIKLTIKTKSETYPILIGANIIRNLDKYLRKNSINFNQCLLVVDKNVPNKIISNIIKSLKNKKIFRFSFNANEKNKSQKNVKNLFSIVWGKRAMEN